jgi:Cu+-exporting ATPase
LASASRKPSREGTIYTCPMHPEIRPGRPGSCPICGMALEPEIARHEPAQSRTRRHDAPLLDRAVLTLPVFTLEMGATRRRAQPGSIRQLSNWISLASPRRRAVGGWPFFVRGWQSLVTRNLNMFTLIAMGTGVA